MLEFERRMPDCENQPKIAAAKLERVTSDALLGQFGELLERALDLHFEDTLFICDPGIIQLLECSPKMTVKNKEARSARILTRARSGTTGGSRSPCTPNWKAALFR
jgi:hypothetical protein